MCCCHLCHSGSLLSCSCQPYLQGLRIGHWPCCQPEGSGYRQRHDQPCCAVPSLCRLRPAKQPHQPVCEWLQYHQRMRCWALLLLAHGSAQRTPGMLACAVWLKLQHGARSCGLTELSDRSCVCCAPMHLCCRRHMTPFSGGVACALGAPTSAAGTSGPGSAGSRCSTAR